jgi:hypothetical protein
MSQIPFTALDGAATSLLLPLPLPPEDTTLTDRYAPTPHSGPSEVGLVYSVCRVLLPHGGITLRCVQRAPWVIP